MNKLDKTEVVAKEVGSLKSSINTLEKENKALVDKLIELEKKGLNAKEIKKVVNKEFADSVKNAKNVDDLVGKSFFIKKDAKIGDNTYEDIFSNIEISTGNSYDIAKAAFGETEVSGNTVNHTVHQGRSTLTKDGEPVEECEIIDDCDYNYSQARFPVSQYSCALETSVQFTEFVNGGAANIIQNLVYNTDNLFTKASLNLDDQSKNLYGLFNTTTDRAFQRINATGQDGAISADDLSIVRSQNNGALRGTGFYFMSNAVFSEVERLKDGQGNFIFYPGANGQTIANFNQVGTIFTRPVYVIPDDIWYKIGLDENATGAVKLFYGTQEAFEYYNNTVEEYSKLVNDIFSDGDVLIQVDKSSKSFCIDLSSLVLRGFGVTDPRAGVLLQNPITISSLQDSIEYTAGDAKTYADLIADLSVTVDSPSGPVSVDYTYESPAGTSVSGGTTIPTAADQKVIIIATTTDQLIAGITQKLTVSVTVNP